MTERRLTVQKAAKVGKEEEPQLTHQQISELLETEGARAFVEAAEERGHVEPTELEAFALEHDLDDADVEQLTRELEAIGLDVRDPRSEEDVKPVEQKAPNPDVIVGSEGRTRRIRSALSVGLRSVSRLADAECSRSACFGLLRVKPPTRPGG